MESYIYSLYTSGNLPNNNVPVTDTTNCTPSLPSTELTELTGLTGTRDFYPADMKFRNWLFGAFRYISHQFGFEEYDAPILEKEELYKRKGGDEIVQQMYNFIDKDGINVTLRPEMTPTMVRMVLANLKETALPLKWFSIPQCWRYETVQRGRKREHFQWNMDIVGVAGTSPTAETELICAIVEFFKLVGLTSNDVGIKVNNRKLLQSILDANNIPEQKFAQVCIIIDKLDKVGRDNVIKLLVELNISNDVATNIVDVICVDDIDQIGGFINNNKAEEAVREINELFEYAVAYDIRDFLQFDPSVVRGLSYYTGIVFEGFDKSKQLRAICGGGRYDNLFNLFGSPKQVPACGFGFGDCVIRELLEMKGLMPTLEEISDVVIAPFNLDYRKHALSVAALLRKQGFKVDMYLEPSKKKIKECFSYADRLAVPFMIFVAPNEWNNGQVRVKNMLLPDGDANKESDIKLVDLVDFLRK